MIGIYLLRFSGTDSVYIGQSVQIEKRYKQHCTDMRSGRASPKMQEAYEKYGLPELEVLAECSTSELDSLEEEAISIFDSSNTGFNTYSSPKDAPLNQGYGHGNTKYSKEALLLAAKLLLDPANHISEIANICGVSEDIIRSISCLASHTHWLSHEYPELYSRLKQLKGNRSAFSALKVSDKLSAKSRGIIYPKILSPDGNIYQVDNAYVFAREHGLRGNHLTEVLNGHRKSHKGWKICPDVPV